MQQRLLCLAAFCLAAVAAAPFLVQDVEDGTIYHLEPIVVRERRAVNFNFQPNPPEPGKLSGGGGANSHRGGGGVTYEHPNGAKASVGYGHANGRGHDASVDYSHPVWSNGKTTVNLGGGFSGHTGGPYGTHGTDRRVGASVTHRF